MSRAANIIGVASADCKLHSRARAFIHGVPRDEIARAWLLSDDPTARQCGGCNEALDPGQCDVDRVAIQWAMAERWEQRFHQSHRPYSASDLLGGLRRLIELER